MNPASEQTYRRLTTVAHTCLAASVIAISLGMAGKAKYEQNMRHADHIFKPKMSVSETLDYTESLTKAEDGIKLLGLAALLCGSSTAVGYIAARRRKPYGIAKAQEKMDAFFNR